MHKSMSKLRLKNIVISKFSYQPNVFPVGIYLLKINNRNARTRYEIYSRLTTKTPERRQ